MAIIIIYIQNLEKKKNKPRNGVNFIGKQI